MTSEDMTSINILNAQKKLFNDVFVKNKKIGSANVKIDKIVEDKNHTLTRDQIQLLYLAKC